MKQYQVISANNNFTLVIEAFNEFQAMQTANILMIDEDYYLSLV